MSEKKRINFKRIFKLKNPVQHYAWGSITHIPQLLGLENKEGKPFAELWMGSHLKAPSSVMLKNGESISLRDFISLDVRAVLGKDVVKVFGEDLPFLFKVLAAASPLSLQTHPSKQQAIAGFTREEIHGIPLNSPNRNYKDTNNKCELLVALSKFYALVGFRPFEEIKKEFNFLHDDEQIYLILKKTEKQSRENRISFFFIQLTALPEHERKAVLEKIAAQLAGKAGPAYHWVIELHKLYPTDIGVLSPLILNMVELKPGQAIFMPSGALHTYLEGFGLEIMTNSDNVLRGGLTPKHIDLPELLQILDFKATSPEIITARKEGPFEFTSSLPVKEFKLSRMVVKQGKGITQSKRRSIEILLILKGKISFSSSCFRDTITALQGESFLIPAILSDYTIRGQAELYSASVNI
jgi:mannose-6-phosphate isomerase